jgi:hypothetical protein
VVDHHHHQPPPSSSGSSSNQKQAPLATSGGSSWSALVLAALVLAPPRDFRWCSAPIGGNLVPFSHVRPTHTGFHGVSSNKKRWEARGSATAARNTTSRSFSDWAMRFGEGI